MSSRKQTIISADVLYDGHKKLENCSVVVEGKRIVEIVKKKMKADYHGFVTPGFIDAHSHIGMDREEIIVGIVELLESSSEMVLERGLADPPLTVE